MPRKKNPTPSYLRHKARNCGKVRIDGTDIYLPGEYDSPESREAYHRLVARYLATGKVSDSDPDEPTINELICQFWQQVVTKRYVKNGKPTSERRSYRTALRPVQELYGSLPTSKFTPLALVTCRHQLIEAGYKRRRINQHVYRIRNCFQWGVEREMVKADTWQALKAVKGLRKGEAEESVPVKPVPDEHIEAIKAFVTPPVWAMIQVQLWSSARPGEVCSMHTCDIHQHHVRIPKEVAGLCWIYIPHSHKTEHHDKDRTVLLGPQAQKILEPWLRPDAPEAFLFSPAEARAWFDTRRRANRKTPMTPSQRKRTRKTNPKRAPGDCYPEHAYGNAIRKACKRAGVPHWFPLQLRHNAGTRLRAAHGIEIARIVLGHSSIATTEIYAEKDMIAAAKAVAESG